MWDIPLKSCHIQVTNSKHIKMPSQGWFKLRELILLKRNELKPLTFCTFYTGV